MNDETINIDEQLDILEETKAQIKSAIIGKGQSVSDQDSFRSYATKIENISTMNAQAKTVAPTTSQQIIEPDYAQDYNALSSVTVNAVTNAIDNNIVNTNIKSGVTILGVTGNVVELNGETKTVTPTTSQQTVLPTGAGKNALTQVTVNAVDNTIDNNIVAGNIKSGVTILGVNGSFEGDYTETLTPEEYDNAVDISEDILGTEPEIQDHYEIEYD